MPTLWFIIVTGELVVTALRALVICDTLMADGQSNGKISGSNSGTSRTCHTMSGFAAACTALFKLGCRVEMCMPSLRESSQQ